MYKDILGFWIPSCEFQTPGPAVFRIPCHFNLDFKLNSLWDSGFLKLNSGFQSPGFRIFQVKYPGFRNMDYLTWQEMLSREVYYMVLRKQCFHV